MGKEKISYLAIHCEDSDKWSIEDMLRNTLADMANGPWTRYQGGKAIVLLLDNAGEAYDWSFNQAGMRCSDIISLLEIVKADFLRRMHE